ncbi:MAG: hypothetical protein NTV98_05380 [Candidatus Roizmanbacteria bacterium]|nr:hypothetical protein [Candidatus Roizmanbacteria bacterium]
MESTNNVSIITKINNLPSELDDYIKRVYQFIGNVILLGNSLVFRITNLFDNLKEKYHQDGMLGNKIDMLEKIGYEKLKTSESSFKNLIVELKEYNKHLNLAKHSLFVGNTEIMKTNSSDVLLGDVSKLRIYKFTESEQEKILDLGSKLNGDISKIMSTFIGKK